MTRRDTILMAVLINAGLLVILFATAITRDPAPATSAPQMVQAPTVEPIIQTPVRPAVACESPSMAGGATLFPDGIAPVPVELPTITEPEESQWIEVKVKRGDTLDKIARANGTTISRLMEDNQLNSTRLQIGDVLRVPKGSVLASNSEPAPLRTSDNYYTIRSGDNPWVVAMKFHVPLDELLRINELDEDGARKLKPGDQIRIR